MIYAPERVLFYWVIFLLRSYNTGIFKKGFYKHMKNYANGMCDLWSFVYAIPFIFLTLIEGYCG